MVKIILGLPGLWADDERESSDHYTTKIGGLPDWPPLSEEALRPELLHCRSCGSRLPLLAQIYAPISTGNSKKEERTLYIFGCLMLTCAMSEQRWRIFRVQKAIDEIKTGEISETAIASPLASASKTNWWDNLDTDEEEEDIDLDSLAKALSEAMVVASNSKKQKKPNSKSDSSTKVKASDLGSETRVVDENTPVVPCFYIYTQEESPSKDVFASPSMNYGSLPIKEGQNGNDDEHGNEETWEDEKYEYDKALNADRTYLKFKKRLDANPEQCFRYSNGGKPLLATEEVKDPENCKLCGASRHFEMQLMPPLIYFLQEAAVDSQKQSLDNWDWMTLIVYTCSKSCSNPIVNEGKPLANSDWIVAEETIAVQYEKPMNLDHVSFSS